jgi:3-oxoadipate enol-lactonase
MPRVEVNGVALYYEQHGWQNEADVVVLSNGVLMSTASWAYQIAPLSARHRLLLYDCRGMGRSDHPKGPYSMEQHADDLAGLLDAVNISSAHIAGISYGGEVSMMFALRHPKRTRSLILSSTVSQVDPLLRAGIGSWVAAARAKDADLLYYVVYPLSFSERWMREHTAEAEQARSRYKLLDFEAVLELFEAFLRVDFTRDLHRISAPTLVMVGDEDIVKPRKYAEIIAHEIRGAEYVIVPGAGHALCWEAPEVFNTAMLGFLAKHARGAQPTGGGT